MQRQFAYTHAPIDFYFKHHSDDFIVTEEPLYRASEDGEHKMLLVRKKNLSTHEVQAVLARECGCKSIDIGVAGLKDKYSLSYQYITLHRDLYAKLENFSHPQIKIMSAESHKNKLKMGHLKGNTFFIRLKKVSPVAAKQIDEALKNIRLNGMPNYFGFQRFGVDGKNYESGELISLGIKRERNKTKRRFLINAYQSYIFNAWLSKRLELSHLIESFDAKAIAQEIDLDLSAVEAAKQQTPRFKLFLGDVMMHYPFGKLFHLDNLDEAERFKLRDSVPAGPLFGKKLVEAKQIAQQIEQPFKTSVAADGARRFAWVFPSDISSEYKSQEHWYELSFFLPKGSYATTLLEEIAKRPIH